MTPNINDYEENAEYYLDLNRLDGTSTGVLFIKKGKNWELQNKVLISPGLFKGTVFCYKKCQRLTTHAINKSGTKIKCGQCSTISELKPVK